MRESLLEMSINHAVEANAYLCQQCNFATSDCLGSNRIKGLTYFVTCFNVVLFTSHIAVEAFVLKVKVTISTINNLADSL